MSYKLRQSATIDGLTLVTNSTAIATIIGSAHETTAIYLLGGSYNENNWQTCGAIALNQLDGFHCNLAMLTAGVVSADAGVMGYNFDEAAIARAMISRSDRVIILADASKFDRVAPFVVASFEQIDGRVSERSRKE